MTNASTDTYLDMVGGLVHTSVQTETAVVSASDFEELGASLAASVEETQQVQQALTKTSDAMDGLLVAIIRRKRIEMDGMRYNVWCEGEVAGLGKLPDGVYVLPFFPLKKGMILP